MTKELRELFDSADFFFLISNEFRKLILFSINEKQKALHVLLFVCFRPFFAIKPWPNFMASLSSWCEWAVVVSVLVIFKIKK